jgi:exonuclease SbcC
VTERARLESLFLDEGFGALDPETLETVVGAIEQLGGDGRMVGVITHVQELAIRLPARIEVEKAPRGSRLRIVG